MAQSPTMMRQRDRVCVVIGMHRSGTSLTTQILQRLGVRLGEHLLPPNPFNEKGSFEQEEIFEAQRQINRILNRRVMSPGGLLPYPERWWEKEAVAAPVAMLKSTVERELQQGSAGGGIWGFKDPHTIRMLPFWRHLFEELEVDPVYLLTVRHPTAVAKSIHARDDIPIEQAEFLWLLHYVDAFRYCGDNLSAVVIYDEWFKSPLYQVKRLAGSLGFGEGLDDDDLEQSVNEVIAPDLRHNLVEDAPPVLPACRTLYDLIQRHAAEGDALVEIAAFIKDFDHYRATFAPWAQLLEKEFYRADDFGRQVKKLRGRSDDFGRQVRSLRSRLKEQTERAVAPGYGSVVRRTGDRVPRLMDALGEGDAAEVGTSLPLSVAIIAPGLCSPRSPHGLRSWAIGLTRSLIECGCNVTLAVILPVEGDLAAIEGLQREIGRSAVNLVQIPDCELRTGRGTVGMFLDEPRRVYEWLKNRNFDVVHAPMLGGDVYFCLLAKLLGIALSDTRIFISAIGSTLSEAEGNNRFFRSRAQLAMSFKERQCLEWADGILFPTTAAYRWYLSKGYRLRTDRCLVTPPPVCSIVENESGQQENRRESSAHPAETEPLELVFIGDLTIRSGLIVFCEAVQLLQSKHAQQIRVTIFGRRTPEFASERYLNEKLSSWTCSAVLKEDWTINAVLEYLRHHRPLVICPSQSPIPVFPALECLSAGLPILLSDDLKLVDALSESDWDYLRFRAHPKFLAAKIEKILTGERVEREVTLNSAPQVDAFAELHTQASLERLFPLASDERGAPDEPHQPFVSVCITHFNRPHLLRQALASLEGQTYQNFEVVIIDDGSDDAEARRELAEIETEISEKSWRVIWGTNRYPGAARNHAVREAGGEYILFMDDDNVAKEDELKVFVNAALYSDADLLTCFRENFTGYEYPQEDDGICCIPALGSALSLGIFANVFGDTNCFIKRSAFERIDGFTEDYGVGKEDYEFFMRACVAGLKFFVVPEMLFWYRELGERIRNKHQDNIVHARQQAGELRVLRPVLETLPVNLFDLVYVSRSLGQGAQVHKKKKRFSARVWRKISGFLAKK